jgi:hypothetical protein
MLALVGLIMIDVLISVDMCSFPLVEHFECFEILADQSLFVPEVDGQFQISQHSGSVISTFDFKRDHAVTVYGLHIMFEDALRFESRQLCCSREGQEFDRDAIPPTL